MRRARFLKWAELGCWPLAVAAVVVLDNLYYIPLIYLMGPIVLALLVSLIGSAIDSNRARAAVIVMVLIVIVLTVLVPSLLDSLVTGGLKFPLEITQNVSPLSVLLILPAILCWLLPPVLLTVAPEILRRRANATAASPPEKLNGLLPGFLATSAALATVLFTLLQHFNGGPLTKPWSATQLSVALLFIMALLIPPYRFIVRAIWKNGIQEVSDPQRWKASLQQVRDEAKNTFTISTRQAWRDFMNDMSGAVPGFLKD